MDPATMMLLGKAGMAVYQGIQGKSKQKEAERAAQRAAAKMRAIEEENVIEGLQVPTLGAELARQELGQQVATSVEALRSAGAAGVLGGIPSLVDVSTDKALEIAAGLQEAEYQRDKFVLQQEQALEGRRVAREMGMASMELQGAQAAVAEGRRSQQEALKLAAEGLTGFAEMKLKYSDLYPQQKTSDMKQYIASEQQKANDFTGKKLELTPTKPLEGPGYYFNSGSPTGETAMVEGFPQMEATKVLSEQEALDVQKRSLGYLPYPNAPAMPAGMLPTAQLQADLEESLKLDEQRRQLDRMAPNPPSMPAGMLPTAQLQADLEQDLSRMNPTIPAMPAGMLPLATPNFPILGLAPNSFPIMPPGLR